MTSSLSESYKREALVAVLTRLGEPMLVMLKLRLAQDFKINIDKTDKYTLGDVELALQTIFGADGSSLLIREIRNEIDLLAKQQTH